jgi:hypothetical protein
VHPTCANIIAIAAAVSAPSFAATTEFAAASKKPMAVVCKKNPTLMGYDKIMASTGDKK